MKDKKIFFFGLLWTCFTGFAFYLMMTSIMTELNTVEDSIPIKNLAALVQEGEGRLVSFEATIAPNNTPVIKQFVLGCEEYYDDSGETSRWRTEEIYVQPLTLTLADDPVRAEFRDDCPRGRTQTVLGHREQRWIGVRVNDPLHIVGGIVSTSPPRIDVVHYYSGTAEAHHSHLTFSRNLAAGVLGFFGLIGVTLLVVGGRPG